MLALPLSLLAVLALAAAAPAAPTAPPADAEDTTDALAPSAPPTTTTTGTAAAAASPLQLTFEALSQEEAPEGELGAGEEMEGAENIVFKPLFRYRERGGFRRRVRAANRLRDATYRRTYAARFPHHRYRSSPKRRNALHHTNQILF